MRFHPASLLLLPGLLTACEPALKSGPRVEFVGSSRFNPSSRRITVPGDTVAVKVYGRAQDGDAPLTRLVIRAEYQPTLLLVDYPVDYNEADADKSSLVYLDTLVANAEEFAFQSVQPTRTSGGRETWRYTFTDTQGNEGIRSFFLRLGRSDSAAAYHSYSVPLQTPARGENRRSFLALREGLALPGFSLRRQPENQQLIDLVCVPGSNTVAPGLATTTDSALNLPWPGRNTQIRQTTLTPEAFAGAATPAQFTSLFNQGRAFPVATRTGPLTLNQVLAFHTPDDQYGLLLVQTIVLTGIRTLVVQVRITK